MTASLVHLPEHLKNELWVYARETPAWEVCGILVGVTDRIERIFPAKNLHPQAEDRYWLDPRVYRKAEAYCARQTERNLQIMGFWHSHPQGPAEPSALDLEAAFDLYQAFRERYLYLILSLLPEEPKPIRAWRLKISGKSFEAVALQ